MSTAKTPRSQLFTVGHSTHEWADFAALLQRHGIKAIADVRSSPYSRFTPQYNREHLSRGLRAIGVAYVFLGRELGARREERECYVDRQARYEKIAESPLFQSGLERIRDGVKEHRIALLCAEKDPITCHRMVLVCHALRDDPIEVSHILDDGSLESTQHAEGRLLRETGMPEGDLFQSREELVREAYARQGRKIAWTEPAEESSGAGEVPGVAGAYP